MGHGSRDPEGVAELALLTELVRAAAPGIDVRAGVLEFPGNGLPSIQDAFDACRGSQGGQVLALPVLLHHAGHSHHDMPAEVQTARLRHPGLAIDLSEPLALDEALLEIALERVQE